jgi:hypothetical protein
MTDSLLLIQESVVARDRERSVRSIIESSSQTDLMSQAVDLMKEMSMKEIFTQRNSSQFEMIENIVSSREQASVRERVVTRERGRERSRDRERSRGQRQERDDRDDRSDRDDINASTEDVSEVIQ